MLPHWRASVPGQTGSEHGAIGTFRSRLSPSLESVQTAERPRLQPAGLEHSLFPSTKAAFFLFRLRMVQASIMDTWSDALLPPPVPAARAPLDGRRKGVPAASARRLEGRRTSRQKLISLLIDNSLRKGIRMPGFSIWAMETHLGSEIFFFELLQQHAL